VFRRRLKAVQIESDNGRVVWRQSGSHGFDFTIGRLLAGRPIAY
jgi:hypothetical protein